MEPEHPAEPVGSPLYQQLEDANFSTASSTIEPTILDCAADPSTQFTPAGSSTPRTTLSNSSLFVTPLSFSILRPPIQLRSTITKKPGRTSKAVGLGLNRGHSDGCIKDIFKRKRGGGAFECSQEESLTELKKPNRCLFSPEDSELHPSVVLTPTELASATISGSLPVIPFSSAASPPKMPTPPVIPTDLESISKMIAEMNLQMSINHESLEAKLATLQQNHQVECDKIRMEFQQETNHINVRFNQLQEELDVKYNLLSKKVAEDVAESVSANIMASITPRLTALEAKSNSHQDLQPDQIKDLLWKLESQERASKWNNIVIKRLPRTTGNVSTDVHKLLSTYFGLEDAFSNAREAGKRAEKFVIVTLRSSELKQSIMKSKYKLKGTNTYIDPDLTKNEREVYG